ncbi:carboxypeptidase-like regulatory domain-containing protein [Gramella sp. GC03-9]|uniref:Carboxypeptidase-like regulatory domain-containing protein n=1 Tax=Christiangramia oceanisediminis TaxID=2920386 RepID=A0A9X2I0T3_9FLAO|nr:carboxypeptidase-like regulatory domain-containing protein [Gramella oceanisediminis]MCP9198851.1 carboxypeptidase-like regulatory domain-containing protein [Gramella oceanisediminis]
MRNRIELINACDQDWNAMKSLGENKFCDKCQKQVIDFTGVRKKEIIEKLKVSGAVCGKLNPSQIQGLSARNRKRNHTISKQTLSKITFFIGFGSMIGLTEPVIAKPNSYKLEQLDKANWQSVLPVKTINDSITVKGKITDLNGEAIPGTNVILKDSRIGTQSNLKGEFIFKIPVEKIKDKNYLIISFIGFKTEEVRFYRKNRYFNIQLTEDNTPLGGIALVQERNLFDKVGNFFHKLFSNHKTCS